MMIFFVWLFSIILTPIIADSKGKSSLGFFVFAVIFGPLALIWVLIAPADEEGVEKNKLMSNEAKKCPYCAELIKPEAKLCRFCGKTLRKSSR